MARRFDAYIHAPFVTSAGGTRQYRVLPSSERAVGLYPHSVQTCMEGFRVTRLPREWKGAPAHAGRAFPRPLGVPGLLVLGAMALASASASIPSPTPSASSSTGIL